MQSGGKGFDHPDATYEHIMADSHGDDKRAATPVSPETAAHLKNIKANEPEKASILVSTLSTLASGLAAYINNEKVSQAAAVLSAVDVSTSLLKTPSVKIPDFNDVGKKMNSVLGDLKTPDMSKLQESLSIADQAPNPNALASFEDQMSKQALARSSQKSAEITAALKTVNGFRNEL